MEEGLGLAELSMRGVPALKQICSSLRRLKSTWELWAYE